MLRFTIRDVLWLTAAVGLVLVWRVENQARQRASEVLNRSEVIADTAALAGRWQVLRMTSNGMEQDFVGKLAPQMSFSDGYWLEWGPDGELGLTGECTIVRPGHINIDTTGFPGFTAPTKWRYRLQGGKLWMIRSKNPGDRPIDFDAANDPTLTLYELNKAELENKKAVPPQDGRISR